MVLLLCLSRWMHLEIIRRTAVPADRIQTRLTVLAILEKEIFEFVSVSLFSRDVFFMMFLLLSDAFADLMSSGTLACQSHISIPSSSQDFPSLIKSICQSYRLTGTSIASRLSSRSARQFFVLLVVDQIELAASLYSETILGQPIALLLKSTVGRRVSFVRSRSPCSLPLQNSQRGLSIDGKSTETHFLSNLMEEIKASLK